jgi:hypothetical protein
MIRDKIPPKALWSLFFIGIIIFLIVVNLRYTSIDGPESDGLETPQTPLVEVDRCDSNQGIYWDESVGTCVAATQLDDDQREAVRIAIAPLSYPVTVVDVRTLNCSGCFIVKLQRDDNKNISVIELNNWTFAWKCEDYPYWNCPIRCMVCPSCEVCSSVSCQTEESCSALGFDRTWYSNITTILDSQTDSSGNEISQSLRKAETIARETEEAKAFLGFYGKCDDCNPSYAIGHPNLIGCVEYSVANYSEWDYLVNYWVSEACSFRYGSTEPQEKINITVDLRTGEVLSRYPDLAYIQDPKFCRTSDDCLCESGSGVPFVGCGNFLHAQAFVTGAYKCGRCECVDSSCRKKIE